MLEGSWRNHVPRLDMSAAEIGTVTPLLLASGAGALGYWKSRSQTKTIVELRASYLRYAAQAKRYERKLQEVIHRLKSVGIEPVLIKGYAISRLYPETGLRPSGDIDLCIPVDAYQRANVALRASKDDGFCVDLSHDEITKFDDRTFEDLYKHSEEIELDGTTIRVPRPEDHLRILCLHFLKHGAWRPLWLCDIALLLETPDLEWGRCLPCNLKHKHWVLCTIGLAQQLLKAEIQSPLPDRQMIRSLPPWLVPAVLKQWCEPYAPHIPPIRFQLRRCLEAPSELFSDLARRWPNPIQATIDMNGRFDSLPRLPFQIRSCLERAKTVCFGRK